MWHVFNASFCYIRQFSMKAPVLSHLFLPQGVLTTTGWSIFSIWPIYTSDMYTSEPVLKFSVMWASPSNKRLICLKAGHFTDELSVISTLIWKLKGTWSFDLWIQTIKNQHNICNTNLDQIRKLNHYHIKWASNPFSNSISNGPWYIFSVKDYSLYCIVLWDCYCSQWVIVV